MLKKTMKEHNNNNKIIIIKFIRDEREMDAFKKFKS